MSKLEKAKQFMKEAHVGQTRWDEVTPYEVHPIEVVEVLQKLGITDEEILITGYLHDILEDTKYIYGDIVVKFGSRVAKLVDELTFKQSDDEYYISRCKWMSKDASWVKIADIIANLNGGKKSQHFIEKRTKALEHLIRNVTI